MQWHIGTSGWGYPEWRGVFYPPELEQRKWLTYYAQHFDAVEINTSFYHLPAAQRIKDWPKAVPKDFIFTIKGSSYITHYKRLKAPRQSLARFMNLLKNQKKPWPVVFQLPPRFKKDATRLEKFLEALPKKRRYAIEFRDPSWHDAEIYGLLRRRGVAFCLFEKGKSRAPRITTADFSYVRLHGRKENYQGNYTAAILKDWRDWLARQSGDAYVFFDNTGEPDLAALRNAKTMQHLTGK